MKLLSSAMVRKMSRKLSQEELEELALKRKNIMEDLENCEITGEVIKVLESFKKGMVKIHGKRMAIFDDKTQFTDINFDDVCVGHRVKITVTKTHDDCLHVKSLKLFPKMEKNPDTSKTCPSPIYPKNYKEKNYKEKLGRVVDIYREDRCGLVKIAPYTEIFFTDKTHFSGINFDEINRGLNVKIKVVEIPKGFFITHLSPLPQAEMPKGLRPHQYPYENPL